VLKEIAKSVTETVAVIGFVDRKRGGVYNSAAVISEGAIKGIYCKMRLPNYAVFDEKRYFTPGKNPLVFLLDRLAFGRDHLRGHLAAGGPAAVQAKYGARLICTSMRLRTTQQDEAERRDHAQTGHGQWGGYLHTPTWWADRTNSSLMGRAW